MSYEIIHVIISRIVALSEHMALRCSPLLVTRTTKLLFHSTGLGTAILDPAGAADTANTRCLFNVWKVFRLDSVQAKRSDVRASDATGLSVNNIDNASWWIDCQTTRANDAVFKAGILYHLLLVILIVENFLHCGWGGMKKNK
jgi:hypothetical protein